MPVKVIIVSNIRVRGKGGDLTYFSRSQFKMKVKYKRALQEFILFIVTTYIKPWFGYGSAVNAPKQD